MPSRDRGDLAKRLMSRAAADSTALVVLSQNAQVDDTILGFHAQQAVEKALKSVLASRGVEYRWTHDLRYLVDLLEEHETEVAGDVRTATELTPWATEFRYGEAPDTRLDRLRTVAMVDRVMEWAAELVGED